MSKFVLTNCRVFFGAADLSGDTNEATVTGSREVKDTTNYLSGGWKEEIAGLGSSKIEITGYTEASATPATVGLPDDTGFANFGLLGGVTLAPTGAADGAPAYLTNVLESDFNPLLGKIGDVAGFKLSTVSSWPLVKGVIATPPSSVLAVGSGTGTINNLGAVAAGKQVYADIHVISTTGAPSLVMTVQSAALVGFGSPTTRLTFGTATSIGSQIIRTPGPITDAFWRASWTVSGTGSVLAVVTFGIA